MGARLVRSRLAVRWREARSLHMVAVQRLGALSAELERRGWTTVPLYRQSPPVLWVAAPTGSVATGLDVTAHWERRPWRWHFRAAGETWACGGRDPAGVAEELLARRLEGGIAAPRVRAGRPD